MGKSLYFYYIVQTCMCVDGDDINPIKEILINNKTKRKKSFQFVIVTFKYFLVFLVFLVLEQNHPFKFLSKFSWWTSGKEFLKLTHWS